MKLLYPIFFLSSICLFVTQSGYSYTYRIINDTPTDLKLDIELDAAKSMWKSRGGIGEILPTRIENNKVKSRSIRHLDTEGSKNIKVSRYSRGAIWQAPMYDAKTCWKYVRVSYPAKPGTKFKKMGIEYPRKKIVRNVLKGNHCQDHYAVIRPKVKKSGQWEKDEYGNYNYFADRLSKKEFERYWDRHKARIEGENQRLANQEESALKRQIQDKKKG